MHGQGIAGKCISYAVNECRKCGIYDLRMDTHVDNIPMQRFLIKNDFRKCGIVCMEDGSKRLAYHRIIIKNVVFIVFINTCMIIGMDLLLLHLFTKKVTYKDEK